jgi:hypothetical protein
MIIVRVELHSAITGKVTELARMMIANTGAGSATRGDYTVETYRGRDSVSLAKRIVQRAGAVTNYPRQAIHVWHLVARALHATKYIGAEALPDPIDEVVP